MTNANPAATRRDTVPTHSCWGPCEGIPGATRSQVEYVPKSAYDAASADIDTLIAERDQAYADVDRLRAKLKELAGECASCHGKGVLVPDWGREHPDSPPCPDCADIRELLP